MYTSLLEKISWEKNFYSVRNNAFHGSIVITSPDGVVFHLFTEEPRLGCFAYYASPRVRDRLLFEINNIRWFPIIKHISKQSNKCKHVS